MLAVVLAAGCRCGEGPASAGGQAGGEGHMLAPDEIPDTPLTMSLDGRQLGEPFVQVVEEDGTTRLEIMDRAPDDPCGGFPLAEGFSLRVPGRLERGAKLHKTPGDTPPGFSAYMLVRDEAGGGTSILPQGYGLALVVDRIDADEGSISGRIAVGFDDEKRSGASGRFEGAYCPHGT
jgi:hypothetical protein